MDIYGGLVPSDNILSSLNFDSIDLSGLYPSQISSYNSLFTNQMWSDPTTCIQESNSYPNVSSYNNNFPLYSQGGSINNPSLDSVVHELNNQHSYEGLSSSDDILKLVCDAGLDSALNDDILKSLVADNGMHVGYKGKEESLEDIVMSPLIDNKNVNMVPKKGLFSQLGLDELLCNKGGSISSSKHEDQFSSPKRQRMDCYTTIDKSYPGDVKSCITAQTESSKNVKKRAKPGQSTRPRPKDRQMIQDRLKELRDIIPNGAKCSIDALLERTIKHMVFMQGVKKYGEKLNKVDEIKAERGNENGGISGSAAWAIDVGGQNPIVVEDIGHSGQMLIEMLCENHGFFLEIADVIRGFGLTILKGVMEAREDKIWANFIVEANRDVTRMQVLISLLQLLQDKSTTPLKMKTIGDENKVICNNTPSLLDNYHNQPMMSTLPIGLADTFR